MGRLQLAIAVCYALGMVVANKTSTYKPAPIDVAVLIITPILATIVTWALPLTLLVSTLLFFGLPALYISWRRTDVIARSSIFALLITVLSIMTTYLAIRDESWAATSSFHVRLAGAVSIEALIWTFLFSYLILVYFLFFYDHAPHKLLGKRMPAVFLGAFAVIVWLLLVQVADVHFRIDFFYIKAGLVLILFPLLAFLFSFPQYVRVFIKITPYFIVVSLLNLLVSLDKELWSYPGQNLIGWITFGPYRFPVEELLFWIILYPALLVSQFEFFNNDQLKRIRVLRTSKTKRTST